MAIQVVLSTRSKRSLPHPFVPTPPSPPPATPGKVATSNSLIVVINFPPVEYGVNGPDQGSASISFSKTGETSQPLGQDTQSNNLRLDKRYHTR